MPRIATSFIILLLVSLALTRCAQIVAPTGGPRDSIPPVLVKAVPPDSSLHFKARKIELSFDEFIQLKDLQKQMIIAPNPKRQPQIRAKLRTLTIEWNDTLLPNTTYIINMGNAIEDINEGNPLDNFRYVFSTGDYLDSLEVSGKIANAETGLPDSLMAVMLYNVSDTGHTGDSIVTKEKPVYYTRTKGDGSFIFQNLPHRTFRLFALQDANGDLQYNDSTEAIAFLEQPLPVDSNIHNISLFAFLEKENKPAAQIAPSPDTGKKAKSLVYSVHLNNGQQDLNKPLQIAFNTRLRSIDSNKISLQEDTTFRPARFTFNLDTSRKEADLAYPWKESMSYRLILDSSFATDTSGLTSLKRDTVNFRTKSLSDYGSLILHFTTSDTTGLYVVQLFENDEMLIHSPLQGNTWKTGYLEPGEYKVRILKDDNRNGQWDRGCYYCEEKRQPEKVYSLPEKFTVKSNWDNDFTDLKFSFEK